MAKNDSAFLSVIKIFFKGIKLYFMNFEKFFKYMAFPVFGQVLGIFLIFLASFVFTVNVPTLTTKSPIFDNIPMVFLLLLLLTLPGFFIFCKAFWDYLIAMASLNSMASTLLEGGSLDDLGMHAELIKRRTGSYILLLLLLSLIYLIGLIPIFLGLLAIVFVYLALSFQVFALEEDKSAFGAIKTSFNLVKFNFFKTLFLIFLLGLVTYWLVPSLVCWGFEAGNLTGFFSYPAEQYVKLLPINDFNAILAATHLPFVLKSHEIAISVVLATVAFIITGLALPIRCLCCTSLYKEIHKKNYAGKIAADKLVKRAKKTGNSKGEED